MLAIKRNGATVAAIEPDGSSSQEREASGMDALRLSFSLPHCRAFLPGDTAEFRGDRYYLALPPTVRREQGRHYAYRLDMEGEQHWLGRARYRQANPLGQYHANPFHINGTAADMMALLLANMRRVFPEGGWKLGQVIGSELKNLHFEGASCLSALNDIASAFGTEWHVEGRTVHLFPRHRATGLVLRQGSGRALYSIEMGPAGNGNPVTRLYAYGGTRNLPLGYRNGRQRLGIGAIPYIEGGTAEGVWEDDWTDETIYPMNEGTVTAVHPTDPLRFSDAGIPFDVNGHLAPGLSAKASFQTGQLAGYELEISTFNNATKEFRLKRNTAETSLEIPSDLLRPAVGDAYFVHGVRMPPAFVERAEQRLKEAAQRHMDERNSPDGGTVYRIACNPMWFRDNGIALRIGDSVRLVDDEMGVDTAKRVVKLTRNVRDPYAVSAEIADRPKRTVF